MKRALLAAAVPAALLAGSLATRVLLVRAPARLAGDLAQPLPVVSAWSEFGVKAFAIFALALVLAALAALRYASTIRGSVPARGTERTIWLAAVASAAAALSWPVIYSSDVYAYAAYGEMTLRGIDPYLPPPANLHAPFVDLARAQWGGAFPPCIYGTGFAGLAREFVRVFGARDPARTLFAFRALESFAWLACAYVFSLLARFWFAERRSAALALFALNPLGIWCAAEGHNDPLIVLAGLFAALAVARAAFLAGGLVFGLTPLLKASGAAAGAFVALYFVPRLGARRGLELCGGFALGLAVAGLLDIGPMWPALVALGAHGRYAPQVSLHSVVGALPALALAGIAALAGLRALARAESSGALWLALALPLALPNPYPWYMMWVLPVAAAARGPAGTWLWIGTIAGSLRYLPDALGPLRSHSNMLAVIVTLAPLAVVAALLLRSPAAQREAPARS